LESQIKTSLLGPKKNHTVETFQKPNNKMKIEIK